MYIYCKVLCQVTKAKIACKLTTVHILMHSVFHFHRNSCDIVSEEPRGITVCICLKIEMISQRDTK